MRSASRLFWSLLAAAIIVALAIFAAQNLEPISARFINARFTPRVWWVVLGSALLGLILGLLLVGPSRVATGWRLRRARLDTGHAQAELAALRERHAALQAERDTMQAERDHLRSRVIQLSRSAGAGAGAQPTTPPAGETVTTQTTTRAPAPEAASPRGEPTITDRLRGVMRRFEPGETGSTELNDQTTAPRV